MLYPILFSPIFKNYLWGGGAIHALYGKGEEGACIAESWEISDREDDQSIISNGPLKGTTLSSLVKNHSHTLFGPGYQFETFPLLLKIIDANKPLSVQVHPSTSSAKELGGEPKTECWHILDTQDKAIIYAGFNKSLTKEDVAELTRKKEIADHLQTFEAEPSQTYFIPSGTVHAIGAGCLLFEVQQNSNTTYRLDDWGRVDKEGRARDLHIKEALSSLDYSKSTSALQQNSDLRPHPYFSCKPLAKSSFFEIDEITVTEKYHPYTEHYCHMLFCKEGEAQFESEVGNFKVTKGQTMLMPKEMGPTFLRKLSQNLTFLQIALPRNV